MKRIIWLSVLVMCVSFTGYAQEEKPAEPAVEQLVEPAVEQPAETPVKKEEEPLRMPMIQCLNRDELKALMGTCWKDASTVTEANNVESVAILAAAIFRVRVDNIQSGKEPYVRLWNIERD